MQEQTPTFKCIERDEELHHAEVGDIIKMSPKSLEEFDKDYPNWRDKYVELNLDEELKELNNKK